MKGNSEKEFVFTEEGKYEGITKSSEQPTEETTWSRNIEIQVEEEQ